MGNRVRMDVCVAVSSENRISSAKCIRADDECGEHGVALVSVRLREADSLPVGPSPCCSSLVNVREDVVPSDDVSFVLSLAWFLGEPHLEKLPARGCATAHRPDRLPILLGVHDGKEDGKMDNKTFVLGKGFAERSRHVQVGTIVSVDDTDDMFDGIILSLKTL